MTIKRNLIQQAFPNQPQMQAAFEALVADAEAATANLNAALAAISGLSGGAEDIVTELAGKQAKNLTLTAISLAPPDPGVFEQMQPGTVSIRPIDAEDKKSLLTRELADSRYLGAAHAAPGVTDGDKGDIIISGGVWSFDSSVVTAFARTLLDDSSAAAARATLGLVTVASTGSATDLTTGTLAAARLPAFSGDASSSAGSSVLTFATVNLNTGTFGGAKTSIQASFNGKGLVTSAAAVTIQPDYSSIDVVPTSRFLGRVTAGMGFAEALTATQAKTLLAITAADVSGLAAIATSGSASDLSAGTVPAGRMPAHTGDATSTAGTVALTLATVNANVGTFGSATQVATFTVNAKGLITAAGNVTITPAVGSITGLGTGVATALAVNIGAAGAFVTFNGALGTPSSGTLTNCTFPTLNQNTTGSAGTLNPGRNIDGQAFNGSADITVIAPGTHAATSKATPVDADELPLVDSAASNVLKKLTWGNLKATLKAYLDMLYQPLSSALTTLAGLSATTDNFIVSVSSAWASRTPAQVRTTLGLVIGTNVQAWDADLDALASGGIASARTTYTPTLTPSAGSFTSAAATGRYWAMGKMVFLQISVTITTNGTASGYWDVSLPPGFTAVNLGAAQKSQPLACSEDGVTGSAGRAVILSSGTVVRVVKYDGTYLGANGYVVNVSGYYEAA